MPHVLNHIFAQNRFCRINSPRKEVGTFRAYAIAFWPFLGEDMRQSGEDMRHNGKDMRQRLAFGPYRGYACHHRDSRHKRPPLEEDRYDAGFRV